MAAMQPRFVVLRALLAASACSTGCSARMDESTPNTEQSDGGVSERASEAPLAIAERLAIATPELLERLAPSAGTWAAADGSLISPGWRAGTLGDSYVVGAKLPTRANQPFTIALGRSADHSISLVPEAALDASSIDDKGRVTYRAAYRATDLLWVATEHRVEWFHVLHDVHAPNEFAWRVALPHALPAMRAEPDGSLAILDRGGTPRLRVARPYAVDAGGTRRDATIRYVDGRLVLRVDTDGLRFPVLLDPAIETAVWEQKIPTPVPALRVGTPLAYDSARRRTVMFGGAAFGSTTMYLGDTWEWDGTTWTNRTPTTSPSPRRLHGLAYDSARGKVVLFGGDAGTTHYNDTWEWDGTTWTQKAPPTSPSVRSAHRMVYDSARGKIVLFAGMISGVAMYRETWEYDGTTWTQRTPATSPLPRVFYGFAYDTARSRTVLFGGFNGMTFFGDTWEWDGTNWTERVTSPSPAGRSGTSATYDIVRGKTVVHGGYNATINAMTDTWEWDGSTWTTLGSATNPARRDHGLAYDASRRRVVMMGGPSAMNDTWEYHTHGGPCTSGAQCATSSCVDGVCCEESTCTGTCMACNLAASPGVCSPVKNADDPDTCSGTKTCGPSGSCGLVKGTTCAAPSDCASGVCADGVCCDTACSGVCDVCSKALGATADGTCSLVAGYEGSPSCGAYACTGTSSECTGTSCTGDAQCGANYFCATGGKCEPRKLKGVACAPADCLTTGCRVCESGSCVDGVCCATATCSAPLVCNAPGSLGTCSKPNGTTCANGAECGSGFCADGVCCNARCGATCEACDVEGKIGSCSPVTGAARGGRVCAGTCKDGTCVSGSKCSDDGRAVVDLAGNSTPCLTTKCRGGVCIEVCATTDDCAPGHVCGSGRCEAVPAAEDDGGCGVSRARRPSWILLVMAVFFAAVRRRRRRPA